MDAALVAGVRPPAEQHTPLTVGEQKGDVSDHLVLLLAYMRHHQPRSLPSYRPPRGHDNTAFPHGRTQYAPCITPGTDNFLERRCRIYLVGRARAGPPIRHRGNRSNAYPRQTCNARPRRCEKPGRNSATTLDNAESWIRYLECPLRVRRRPASRRAGGGPIAVPATALSSPATVLRSGRPVHPDLPVPPWRPRYRRRG